MKVAFVDRNNGPQNLICEAEIVFEEGPLAGTKLIGFTLWRGKEGGRYVTFPSKSIGSGEDRKFFDYLRGVGKSTTSTRKVKDWISEEYKKQRENDGAEIEEEPQSSVDSGVPF